MLQRCEQIRSEPSFFLANGIEIAALQQKSEKTLREILRLFRFNALSSHKTVNWSPICAPTFFQCLLRCGGCSSRREHNAPMRSRECRRTVLRASADSGQRRDFTTSGHVSIQLKSRPEIKAYPCNVGEEISRAMGARTAPVGPSGPPTRSGSRR